MRNAVRLLDVLDRMESGTIIEEEAFDMTLVPNTMAALQEKYDIHIPADGPIVPGDDAFADRLFEAGLEMSETIGVMCTDTGRRMIWTRNEILDAMGIAPSQLTIGAFPDAHTQVKRLPEDTRRVTIKGGPVGTPSPENLYLAIQQSYAQEPLVDLMIDGSLESVYGREGRSHSPWEVLLSWHEMEMVLTAVQRAGRPGLGIGCTEDSVSEIGELSISAADRLGPHHWHHIAMISEFKTNYALMTKVAHLIKSGSIIHSFYNTIYGGTAGGREGMAIAIVGGCILLQMAYMTTTHSVSPTHPFYGNTTTPDILRALAPAQQAISRNSHLLNDVVITPVGGPGTKTLLYEVAAQSITSVSSGAAGLIGPRSAAGTQPGHVSGLEARFMAEVAHAVRGMSRGEANRLVVALVKRYQDQLDQRPIGERFDQVYDVVRVQPTQQWTDTYEEVKDELRQMGLNLDSASAHAAVACDLTGGVGEGGS
jgi:methylamine--corrinoid protein Co-methyltransferase